MLSFVRSPQTVSPVAAPLGVPTGEERVLLCSTSLARKSWHEGPASRPCSQVMVCLIAGWLGHGGDTPAGCHCVGTNVSVVQVMAVKLGKAGGFSEHFYNSKELCVESPVTKVRNGGGFWFLHLNQ